MNTNNTTLHIAATYCSQWQDGFGARGWKLNSATNDPMVIASNAETGDRIPTSVFVHDILDHHLSGLQLSGHRNEAIALTLLGERTATSPLPDFAQMVDEDLIRGNLNGEPMHSFLPAELVELAPLNIRHDNKLLIGFLMGRLGENELREQLIQTFVVNGRRGYVEAKRHWQCSGLDFKQRTSIGLAIQQLLKTFDEHFAEKDIGCISAEFILSNQQCTLITDDENFFRTTAAVKGEH